MVGALDEGMTKICEEHGIPTLSIEANSIKNRGAANLRFDYSAYKRMAAMKVQFYSNILRLGFNVWACDADTAWMAHPAPSAREAPCGGGAQRHSCRREQAPFVNEYPMQYVDILTTTDCIDVEGDTKGGCWHVDHNTGLVYMRARQGVLDFTAAWKQKIETTRDVMIRDQAALNLLMREGFRSKEWEPPPDPQGRTKARPIYKAWNDRLKIARLPLRYFANGHTFFVQRMYARKEADGSDHPPPFALHMTYQCASPPPRQRHRRRPRRRTRPAPPPPPPRIASATSTPAPAGTGIRPSLRTASGSGCARLASGGWTRPRTLARGGTSPSRPRAPRCRSTLFQTASLPPRPPAASTRRIRTCARRCAMRWGLPPP